MKLIIASDGNILTEIDDISEYSWIGEDLSFTYSDGSSGRMTGLKAEVYCIPSSVPIDIDSPSVMADIAEFKATQSAVRPTSDEILKRENRALSDRVDFLEEVLTEMIFSIYEK